jgi:hypothetical protein
MSFGKFPHYFAAPYLAQYTLNVPGMICQTMHKRNRPNTSQNHHKNETSKEGKYYKTLKPIPSIQHLSTCLENVFELQYVESQYFVSPHMHDNSITF